MKKDKKVKLDSILISILKKESFDSFTVIELRNKYMNESKEDLCASETRKFIYKQILRLVNLGLLVKKGIKNSQDSTYKKTSLFGHASLEINSRPLSIARNKQAQPSEVIVIESDTLKTLRNTLKEYQVDMMASIGESEEYIRLFAAYPEMKVQLKSQYHIARERSSKLLGQIKAIETVISLQVETR